MKRQTIAVDIDDVLADHVAAFAAFSNANYGTNISKHNYDDAWSKLWEVDRREIERRALEFHTAESIMQYELIEAAKESLEHLAHHYDLAVVSARPMHVKDASERWLAINFGNMFREVHFLPYWEENNTLTKADLCKRAGADYLIDDIVKHCNIAAENGLQGLLFGDYSWNQADNIHSSVKRLANWKEVVEYFDEQRSR